MNSSHLLLESGLLPSMNSNMDSLVVPPRSVLSVNSSSVLSNGSLDESPRDMDWMSEYLMRHSPGISSIYCVAYSMVFIMGIIGNSCVVAVVVRSPRMRTVTNYFIVNLALADILVLLFCLPATLLSNLFIPWLLGPVMCKTVSYLQGVAVSASINTLVAVSVDRFLAICYPLKCQMTRSTARKIIIVIWLFSLVIAAPWFVVFQLEPMAPDDDTVMLCNERWPNENLGTIYFVIANLCLFYLIPLIVITVCYLAIWLRVWRRNIPGAGETSDSRTGKSLNLQMDMLMQRSKLKVAKMMVVVVVIFVISWLPLYCIVARFKLGGQFEQGSTEENLFMTLLPIAQWLGSSNSCINPILYAFFNKKYRKGFAAIIKSKKCCGTIRYEASSAASAYYRSQQSTRRVNRMDTQCEFFSAANGHPKVNRVLPD